MEKVRQAKITKEDIIRATPNSIIGGGLTYMNGNLVKYVIVRGGIPDFAIYYGDVDRKDDWIVEWGDKITNKNIIKAITGLDGQIINKMYRY